MNELQIVVSVVKTTSKMSPKAFWVKNGLKTVGVVYLIPARLTAYSHLYDDIERAHQDGTCWIWEHGENSSMDLSDFGESYDSRMKAVFALLGAVEESA